MILAATDMNYLLFFVLQIMNRFKLNDTSSNKRGEICTSPSWMDILPKSCFQSGDDLVDGFSALGTDQALVEAPIEIAQFVGFEAKLLEDSGV